MIERRTITSRGKKRIDIVGHRFGRLEVIAFATSRRHNGTTRSYWLCRCDCGMQTTVEGQKLKSNHTQSCGCKKRENLQRKGKIGPRNILLGERFGRWVVLAFTEYRPKGNSLWLCQCDCGVQKNVPNRTLKSGESASCGCLQKHVVKSFNPNPIRREAHEQGQNRYFAAICQTHPHLNGKRITASSSCVMCSNEYQRIYKKQPKARKNRNAQRQKRRQVDLQYKMACILRGRLRQAIRAGKAKKIAPTAILVGCDVSFLINYLERKFLPGMSWENHGPAWHVDHIAPVASFDLTQEDQQRQCFHYSNLQPLWGIDNQRKGARLDYRPNESYGAITNAC